MTVVLTLVQTKQIRINIHKRRQFFPFQRGGTGYSPRPDHLGFVLEKVVVRQVLGSAETILDVAVHLRMYDVCIISGVVTVVDRPERGASQVEKSPRLN